jgi:putative ABC transport system ATP-binding protein
MLLAVGRQGGARAQAQEINAGLGGNRPYRRRCCLAASSSGSLAQTFVVQPAAAQPTEPTGNLDFATGETVMQLMFVNQSWAPRWLLIRDRAIASRCWRRITIEDGSGQRSNV